MNRMDSHKIPTILLAISLLMSAKARAETKSNASTYVSVKKDIVESKKNDINIEDKFEKKYTKSSGVKIITTDMGVKIFYMKDTVSPIVRMSINFRNSGSAHQEKGKIGVPKLYSSTTFCGCGPYTQAQFEQKASNISSSMSCDSSMDSISFSLTVPSAVLDDAVSLFQLAITQPKFEKEKFLLIQNSLIGAVQSYASNPVAIAKEVFLTSMIFKSHPYENGSIGASEDIAKLSIDDLLKYKDQFLTIKNAEACVFGDISEEKAKSVVDQLIKGLKKGETTSVNIAEVDPDISDVIKYYYAEGTQSTIVFAMKSKRIKSPDRYAAKVLFHIFGGRGLFRGRIMDVLRSKLGLIYSGGATNVDYKHSGHLLGILCTDNSKVKQAISEIRNIIKDMKENGITQEELDFAKKNISGSFLVGLRTTGDMLSFFSFAMMRDLGANAINDTLNGIHNVSLSDVKRVAKDLMDENKITIVVIGGNEK